MFKNDYWYWESGVSKTVCKAILDDIDWGKSSRGNVFDSSIQDFVVDSSMRLTDVVWHRNLDTASLIAGGYLNAANSEAGWGFALSGLEDVQIGRYSVDGHYDWHTDDGIGSSPTYRKLSFVLLLNDPSEYEGGVLEIESFNKDRIYTKEMKCGSVIVFPSCLKHRVTPVTKGTRYSAVGWASGPYFR